MGGEPKVQTLNAGEYSVNKEKENKLRKELKNLYDTLFHDWSGFDAPELEKKLATYKEIGTIGNVEKDLPEIVQLGNEAEFPKPTIPGDENLKDAWEKFKSNIKEIEQEHQKASEIAKEVYPEFEQLSQDLKSIRDNHKLGFGPEEQKTINTFIDDLEKPSPDFKNAIEKMENFAKKMSERSEKQKKPIFRKLGSAIKHYSKFVGFSMMGRKKYAQESLEQGKQAIFDIKHGKDQSKTLKSFADKVREAAQSPTVDKNRITRM